MTGRSRVPADRDLERALSRELGTGALRIVARRPNAYASTYASEVVTVRDDAGPPRTVFCKFGRPIGEESWGHRGDVAYEAEVYRRVLGNAVDGPPRYHGVHLESTRGDAWLFLESIDEHLRLERDPDPQRLCKAARWIARFHTEAERRLRSGEHGFLLRHDEAYYRGWARRTTRLAGDLHGTYPWLAELCERAESALAVLLRPPLTIVHGEYYPHNILVRDGAVHPVDWQSTAIAAGELDLAALIDGWEPVFADPARDAYRQARWGDAAPEDFDLRTGTALLYLQLRWLGDRHDWTHKPKARPRFERLRSIGERLGWIR